MKTMQLNNYMCHIWLWDKMSYLTSISCLLTYRKCFNRQHGQRLAPYSCKVERVLDWYCISVLFLYVSQQLFTQAERRLWLFSRCSPSTVQQFHRFMKGSSSQKCCFTTSVQETSSVSCLFVTALWSGQNKKHMKKLLQLTPLACSPS